MTLHGVSNYEVDPETNCWNWTLFVSSQTGYGCRTVRGKRWSAHRYAYVQKHGELDPTYDVHHLCHNRRCVNPDHLEALPRDEHGCRSMGGTLTREDVDEMRRLRKEGWLQRDLANRFGVARSSVSRIVNDRVWKAAA